MKKILFVIFMLYLTIAGAFAQEQTTVSQFQGQKITEIEAHGVFSIIVRQGTSTGVTVNIPARFEKQLVLRLNPDGKLQIRYHPQSGQANRGLQTGNDRGFHDKQAKSGPFRGKQNARGWRLLGKRKT